MKVLLINPEMGHGPSRRLCGRSGKCYGASHYSTVYRCQVVEMSFKDFQAASDDIWRAANQVMRRWWPVFVPAGFGAVDPPLTQPQLPPAVNEFWAGYNLAMDGRGLPDEASQAASLGWAYAHGKEEPESTEKSPEAELRGLKWFALTKLARNEGVDTTGHRKDSLIEAILVKRGHGQQPATV